MGVVVLLLVAVLAALVTRAMVRSWRAPPFPAPVHPEVARWSPLRWDAGAVADAFTPRDRASSAP